MIELALAAILSWSQAKAAAVDYLKNPDCEKAIAQFGLITPVDYDTGFFRSYSKDLKRRVKIDERVYGPSAPDDAFVTCLEPDKIFVGGYRPHITHGDTIKYRAWVILHEYIHTLQCYHHSRVRRYNPEYKMEGRIAEMQADMVADSCTRSWDGL